MCLRLVARSSAPSSRGFGLLEAVIAAGLLLTTVAAVSLSIGAAGGAWARLQRAAHADRAVRSAAERLRSLPLCPPSLPTPGGGTAADVVTAVFPHALTWKNTAAARYAGTGTGSGDRPGSFQTAWDEDGVQVSCTAWFLGGPEGPRLLPDDLAGWDVDAAERPPGPALEVLMCAGGPDAARSVRLVLTALPAVAAAQASEAGG